ncbi:MAG: pantetheine-phosphate adenylyltransferase [Firmicutes bacterium]|nr:pantetheine-phosphate adenylyltransferase [Bacillota bacterium]MBQ6811328.1 pantetheine-phosphate adenylyltransferase [Bacillota bacterium]
MRICIYSGTFDPVTNGHMDIITRGAALFDKLIIGVAKDNYKKNLFQTEERIEILKEVTADLKNVEVEAFSGLLMDYCREKGACAVIRGLRAVSDFEYEMQMALMNKNLNPNVETVFLMTSQQHSFISSSIIKDVASLGGSIAGLVPPSVEQRIIAKYSGK